jgi:hypothetical protein
LEELDDARSRACQTSQCNENRRRAQVIIEKPPQQYAPYDGSGNDKTQTRIERNLRPDVPGIWFLRERHFHAPTSETNGSIFVVSPVHAWTVFQNLPDCFQDSTPSAPFERAFFTEILAVMSGFQNLKAAILPVTTRTYRI